jgi:hypothetical protein
LLARGRGIAIQRSRIGDLCAAECEEEKHESAGKLGERSDELISPFVVHPLAHWVLAGLLVVKAVNVVAMHMVAVHMVTVRLMLMLAMLRLAQCWRRRWLVKRENTARHFWLLFCLISDYYGNQSRHLTQGYDLDDGK